MQNKYISLKSIYKKCRSQPGWTLCWIKSLFRTIWIILFHDKPLLIINLLHAVKLFTLQFCYTSTKHPINITIDMIVFPLQSWTWLEQIIYLQITHFLHRTAHISVLLKVELIFFYELIYLSSYCLYWMPLYVCFEKHVWINRNFQKKLNFF